MILPSRTDTYYWHKWIMKAHEIRLCKGRVNFLIVCEICKKSVSKTITKYKKIRLCKDCYFKMTGLKKIGNGSTFPLVVVVFKKTEAKNPSIRSFNHKEYSKR